MRPERLVSAGRGFNLVGNRNLLVPNAKNPQRKSLVQCQ